MTSCEALEPLIATPSPFSDVPSRQRILWGWLAFAALCLLMLASAIVTSTSPKSKSKNLYPKDQSLLRTYLTQQQLSKSLHSISPVAKSSSRSDEVLKQIEDDVAKKKLTDPMAATIHGAVLAEQSLQIQKEDLSVLAGSKSIVDRTVAQILESPRLSRQQAQQLGAELPDQPFVYQLIRAQASEKAGDSSARASLAPSWRLGALALVSLAGIAFLAASVALWVTYLVYRQSGQFRPLGTPMQQISLFEADLLMVRAAQILCGFFLLEFMVAILYQKIVRNGADMSWAQYLTASVAMLAFVVLLFRSSIAGKRIDLRGIGLSSENLGRHILWGLAGFLLELPVALLLGALGAWIFRFLPAPEHPAELELIAHPDLKTILGIVIFGALVAPFWEEIVFRGLFFPALHRALKSPVTAALVSSLVFAAIHPQGIALWLALATVGAMSCALSYHTRSLVPSVVLHAAHNLTIFVIAILIY